MRYFIGLAIAVLYAAQALGPSPAWADKRVALVVGNSMYEHIAALPNVPNDAKAMAALLEAAKFDSVVLLHDQRAADLKRALRQLADRAAVADVAVLFYAGHGIEVDRVNYLIPVDARLKSDLDVEDETVSLDRVLQLLEPARRLRVVLLDACRDNPFAKSMKLTQPTRSVGRGLGRIEAGGSNTLIAFATEPYGVADDGAGPNSPFTAALLKHLATPGLDLRLALGSVRDEVMASTRAKQKPYVTGSLGGGVFALAPGAASSSKLPGDPPLVVPPPPSAAAAEWARVDKSSVAELETFERRHPRSAEAEYARARLKELGKVALVAPPPVPTPKVVPPPVSTLTPPQFKRFHTRPLRLVVPFGAGGPSDTVARAIADRMANTLGQPLMIENRVGAGGAVGAQHVAAQAADGYTVLIHTDDMAAAQIRGLSAAASSGLEPVGLIHLTPMVLVSRKQLGPSSLEGLWRSIKAQGAKLNIATTGVGGSSHACYLYLEQTAGQKLTYVPFRVSAEALGELIAGRVDLMCLDPVSVAAPIAQGAITAHAVLGSARIPSLPGVPTSAEAGMPGLRYASYAGLYVRKGAPKAAIAALNAALQRALADPALGGRLTQMALGIPAPDMRSPEAHARYLAADIEQRTKLFRAAGIAR